MPAQVKEPKSLKGTVALWPVDDEEVEIAISEALALMPKNTCTEDKGTFVRERLYAWGFRVMRAG